MTTTVYEARLRVERGGKHGTTRYHWEAWAEILPADRTDLRHVGRGGGKRPDVAMRRALAAAIQAMNDGRGT